MAGAVKARILTDFPERFSDLPEFSARTSSGRRKLRVTESRINRDWVILRFDGIHTRGQAEELRGLFLEVDAKDARPLPKGYFYIHEIVGLKVISTKGNLLGTVRDVLRTGANDVYIIEGVSGSEIMVPATREVVINIDTESGCMTVKLLPGLQDA